MHTYAIERPVYGMNPLRCNLARPVTGEWSLALLCETNDDIASQFAAAQVEVYMQASAGAFFWSLHHGQGWDHWSFKRSVERGWLDPSLWAWTSMNVLGDEEYSDVDMNGRYEL